MTLIEAAKQARDALVRADRISGYPNNKEAIAALVQAIAEAEQQKPVAWLHPANPTCVTTDPTAYARGIPLVVAQPKREWQGLTDEEIDQGLLRSDYALQTAHAWRAGVVFAMTKLKEKNT